MDQFCACTTNVMLSTIFKDQNSNLFVNSTLFYIRLFDARLHEDELRRSKHVRVIVDCMWKFMF